LKNEQQQADKDDDKNLYYCLIFIFQVSKNLIFFLLPAKYKKLKSLFCYYFYLGSHNHRGKSK